MICKYILIVLLFGSGIDGQTTPKSSTAAAAQLTTTAAVQSTAATQLATAAATAELPTTQLTTAAAPVKKVETENDTEAKDKDSPGKDWTYYSKSGKYYRVFSGFPVTHNEAELICQTYLGETTSRNTSLVTLSSWDEQKFVYSLALMSTNDKVKGEGLWVDATLAHGHNYRWSSVKEDNVKDNRYFDKLFDPFECESCKPRPFRCGVLDLTRGPHIIIPPANRWKFIDCIFKYGFICQMGSK